MKRHQVSAGVHHVEVIDTQGSGPAVLLCHGNSGSADDFLPLMGTSLAGRCRMLALSLPGHGGSEAARDPEQVYSLAGWGQAVAAVVDRLGIQHFWAVGQSLGGHVLMEAMDELPGMRGLMLLSAPPVSLATLRQAMRPDPTGGALFSAALTDTQRSAFVRALLNTETGAQADRVRQDIAQTDPRARACLGASLSQGHMKDERAMLARAAVPVALLAAGDDAFLDPGYHASLPADRLWGGQVIQCPGHGHALHLLAPQRVADTLTDFLFSSQP